MKLTVSPQAFALIALLLGGLAVALLNSCSIADADRTFRQRVKSARVTGGVTCDDQTCTGNAGLELEFRDPSTDAKQLKPFRVPQLLPAPVPAAKPTDTEFEHPIRVRSLDHEWVYLRRAYEPDPQGFTHRRIRITLDPLAAK